jgi:hypothetical protein
MKGQLAEQALFGCLFSTHCRTSCDDLPSLFGQMQENTKAH